MNGESGYSMSRKRKACCTKKFLLGACCGCSTLFIVILLIDAFVVSISEFENSSSEESDLCLENECLKSQVEIASFIDPEVDPCQDFHGFVCGNFIKTSHKDHVSSPMQKEMRRIQNELNHYITEKPLDEDSDMISLQKQFFQACLDVDENRDTNQRLASLLQELVGHPAIKHHDWTGYFFNWTRAMMKAKHLGLPFQWFLTLGVHYRENDTNILQISFDKKCDPFLVNSPDFMDNVAVNMSLPNRISEFYEVIDFREEIKKVCTDHKDATMSIITIKNLNDIYRKCDWLHLIANLTGIQDIAEDTEVATDIEKYIWQLDHLLMRNSKSVQANFIIWSIVEEFLLDLSEPIRAQFAPIKNMENLNRVSICLEETKYVFPYVSEAEFIRQYTPTYVKSDVEEITSFIKKQIKEFITNTDMYKESKSVYLEKLNELNITIGGKVEDYFNSHLESLNFTSSNVIEMRTEINKAYYDSLFNSIRHEGVDEEAFSRLQQSVEIRPSYTPSQNELTIPAALLSDFYYEFGRPSYLKYGGLGILIAESILEIVKEKDENGTSVLSETVSSCIFDDYRKTYHENADPIVISKIYHNTLARDIAFEAYVHAKEESEKTLANLDYSPDQLFWIQSGLTFCFNDLRDEEVKVNSEPLQYLNIGPLKHSTYFGEVFQCETDTPMNPTDKWCVKK